MSFLTDVLASFGIVFLVLIFALIVSIIWKTYDDVQRLLKDQYKLEQKFYELDLELAKLIVNNKKKK